MPTPTGRRAAGFTLAELCVALAVAGVLAAAAWPSFQSQLPMCGRPRRLVRLNARAIARLQ